jgi:hypothetical protein
MVDVEIKSRGTFERALSNMVQKLTRAKSVRVGYLEGVDYPDGTPVALVAAVQNWGAPKVGVPARPFFSNMVAEKQSSWGPAIAANLKATGYDTKRTLELVGEGIKGQLQQAVNDFVGTPLKEGTIKAKGFDKQLIAKYHMLLDGVGAEVKA